MIEIWEQVRDYLPANRRHDSAVGIIRAFVEFGFEQEDFNDIIDEDDVLTAAYNEFFDLDEEEETDVDNDEMPW